MISNFCYDVYTVFWRDWVGFKKYFLNSYVRCMITLFVIFLHLGSGLGRNVSVDGGSYLSFLIPGMIALNSMNISFNTIAAPLNMSRILSSYSGNIFVSPISGAAFVFGKVFIRYSAWTDFFCNYSAYCGIIRGTFIFGRLVYSSAGP